MRAKTEERLSKKIKKLENNNQVAQGQECELAAEFSNDIHDVAMGELDSVISKLPEDRRHSTSKQMLRQHKQRIFEEEALNNAVFRINMQGQTGAGLALGRSIDTLCDMGNDHISRLIAHHKASIVLKQLQGKK